MSRITHPVPEVMAAERENILREALEETTWEHCFKKNLAKCQYLNTHLRWCQEYFQMEFHPQSSESGKEEEKFILIVMISGDGGKGAGKKQQQQKTRCFKVKTLNISAGSFLGCSF